MKPPLEHTLSLPQAPAIVNERHRRIMALLHQQTSLSVSQLAHMLGVSEVTIRKDLTLLEQQQMLYRVHGSAILANPYIQERHVNDKEKLCSDQKRAIGAYAARLVEPRDTILIASGTTTLAMAREIREVEELTAITTSLSVATTLAENDECTVIQLGGVLRNSSFSVVGPFAEQMLRQFSCSKLFFGVDGFDLNYGVTTTNLMGGSPGADDDRDGAEGHRAGRLLEIRPAGILQDVRRRPHRHGHYRRRRVADRGRTIAGSRHRRPYRRSHPDDGALTRSALHTPYGSAQRDLRPYRERYSLPIRICTRPSPGASKDEERRKRRKGMNFFTQNLEF